MPRLHAEPWHEPDPLSGSPLGTVIERGQNYVITSLGGNRFSWESAPQWVSNGVDWVPYIYSRDEAKKCYNVQVGFVAAKIYDTGIVELYDPKLKEVRVKSESWEVWAAGKQATLNAPITWGVVANSSGVFVSRWQTTSKPDGSLTIVYSFVVGASLKHTVIWTSTGKAAVTVQVKQVHLMDFDKVVTEAGLFNSSKSEKSGFYLFGYGSNDFWLLEDQWDMVYDSNSTMRTEKCLQTGEIDFAGKKITYTFGDWTLATGESLVVDPDSATLNSPTQDGYVYGTTRVVLYWIMMAYDNDNGRIVRGFVQWDTTSIPDAATITNTLFKYECNFHYVSSDSHIHAIANKPTDATNANLYIDIADGTVYADVAGFPVVGQNQQIDLGATADSNLQGLLASNWFAIGFQGDVENSKYSAIKSSTHPITAIPKPTLYVEYSAGNTAPTNDACDSTATFDYDVFGWINMTVTDVDLVANLYTVSIKITTSDAKTSNYTWTQGTNTFAETSDANGISSIDAGSTRVNIDANTDKIAFKIKFTQVPALGNCAVDAHTIDDSYAGDTDNYANEFRLIFTYKTAAKTIIFSNSAAKLIEVTKPVTQTLTIGKTASKLSEFTRATTQSIAWAGNAIAEFTAGIQQYLRDATTNIVLSMNSVRASEILKAASQGLTHTSSATRLGEWLRTTSQGISVSGSASKLLEWIRVASQGITLSNSAAKLFDIARSATQSLTITNAAAKLFEITRTASQVLNTKETATRLIEWYKVSTQSITLGNAATRLSEAIRVVAQAITVSSTATKILEFMKTAAQTLTLTNVASKLFDITRTATQGLTIGNAATRLMEALRSATQGITFTSTGARLFESLRAAAQTLNLSSAASRLIDITRQVAQSLVFGLSTLAEKVASYIRSASLTITTSLSATRLIDILKNVAQAITLSPAATRLGEWLRIITQGLSFSSTASNLLEWLRVASQSINITSLASKIFDIIRTTSQNIAISLNANRLIEVIKNVAQSITASLSVNRIYDAFRSVTQSITTTFLATKIREVLRSVSQAITSTFNAERLLDALRSISQTLNITNIANAVYEAAIHLFNRAASLALGITSNTVRLREVLAAASIIFTLASGAIGHVLTLFNVAANVVIHLKSWGYLGALGAVVESDMAGLFLMGIVAGFLLVLLLVFLLTEK